MQKNMSSSALKYLLMSYRSQYRSSDPCSTAFILAPLAKYYVASTRNSCQLLLIILGPALCGLIVNLSSEGRPVTMKSPAYIIRADYMHELFINTVAHNLPTMKSSAYGPRGSMRSIATKIRQKFV
jgi:hypothetical protein